HSEGLSRTFSVVVPKADLEAQLAAKIEEVRPRVRINGFRPGKVPASHIRKVYGPGIMQDLINEAVQKSTQESLEQAKVRPAAEPQLDLKSDIAQVQAGQADLAFDLKVEIMPEIEPTDLSKISIARPVADVSDEQVEEALDGLLKANQTYETKEGAAEDGDSVTVDFIGKIDGEAFDGGSAEDATVRIGAKQFIPGFEEALIGAKAGEERVLNVTFPDTYPVESLAGKAAAFETKVKEVRAPQASVANDEFAKRLGFDDIGALRTALKDRIEADHKAQSRAKAKRALFDKLDAAHEFQLPPGMVEAEFNQIWRQIEADQAADRLDAEDKGKSEDQLRTEYRKIAERRVRLGLLLAEIGGRNKVEVPEQEVARAVAEQARNFPGQEQRVFELYTKNPQLMAQIRAPLYEEKVVDFVLELVNVANETVSRDELFKEDEGLKV
ncbi:MAG: trigger factor, partial [Caulobacterales bacterium]